VAAVLASALMTAPGTLLAQQPQPPGWAQSVRPAQQAQATGQRAPVATLVTSGALTKAREAADATHAGGSQAAGTGQGGGALDLWVDRLQRWFAPDRQGFFPWVGSVMPGGWLTLGGGYRRELWRGIGVDALAGISLRNYKVLDAGVTVPITADDRIVVDVRTRLMDAPRVHFYGVGNDTQEDDLSRFDFEPKRLDARVRVRPQEGVEVGGSIGLLAIDTGPGSGGRSATDLFAGAGVAGLDDSASYRTLGLFAQADRRDTRQFTRRGGWYRVDWLAFADGDDEPYGHQRFDVDVRQFFPIVDERHAAVARVVFTGTRAAAGDRVPHFLMPVLGDGEHLRGFANQRFVDGQRLLAQGEYRYRLTDQLHVAGFADVGRVAPSVGDLGPGGMHLSGGGGLRMQTAEGFSIRADLARSREQWAFIVSSVIF